MSASLEYYIILIGNRFLSNNVFIRHTEYNTIYSSFIHQIRGIDRSDRINNFVLSGDGHRTRLTLHPNNYNYLHYNHIICFFVGRLRRVRIKQFEVKIFK